MRTLGPIVLAALAATGACSKSDRASPPAAVAATAETAPAADRAPPRKSGKSGKREDRHEPANADAPPLQLTVAVDGAAQTWHQDAFDKVARFTGNTKASDGEDRNVWSLRDLARTLVGPGARVTSVTGDDGTRAIDRTAWDDAARTPILHTTRRGTLKFRWADATGAWGDTEIRDVTRIEVTR